MTYKQALAQAAMDCDCDYCCPTCGPHATNCTSQDTAPADPSDDYYA